MSNIKVGRPRDEDKKQQILKATMQLLKKQSIHTLSIEAIAKEAGVGKATIYRGWAGKYPLIIEATKQKLLALTDFSASKNPTTLLRTHFMTLVQFFNKREGKILLELLIAGQTDKKLLSSLRQQIITPRREAVKQVVQNGIHKQIFKPQKDIDWLIDATYGPIYYQALINPKALDEAFAKQHATFWLKQISQNSP